MSSDDENDLFGGDEAQAPVVAPSPGAESSKSADKEDVDDEDQDQDQDQANDLVRAATAALGRSGH